MGWGIQVEKWVPAKQISEIFSDKLQLWVQIHNLPVEYKDIKYAIRFAEKAGQVIQSLELREGKTQRDEVRKYTKFKVEIDI